MRLHRRPAAGQSAHRNRLVSRPTRRSTPQGGTRRCTLWRRQRRRSSRCSLALLSTSTRAARLSDRCWTESETSGPSWSSAACRRDRCASNALLRLIGGVSHRMLTPTLRALEHDGLVKRTVYPSVPAKVEHELTDVGRSLIKPLSALSEWGAKQPVGH